MIQKIAFICVFSAFFWLNPLPAAAESQKSEAFRSTEYPLPRFVSLRSSEVYVRTGPGKKYPVQWIFRKKGIPVEIVLEYDVWRRIKDFDGHEGWVHKSLLSGKRTGFIQSEEQVSVRIKPKQNSKIQAYLEPEVLIDVVECGGAWCRVNAAGYKGWLKQSSIWGVYESEKFD